MTIAQSVWKAQNPVANVISLPFQANTNLGFGPFHQPQEILNIEPVIPISITPDWDLITRSSSSRAQEMCMIPPTETDSLSAQYSSGISCRALHIRKRARAVLPSRSFPFKLALTSKSQLLRLPDWPMEPANY
jgi:hypothetical protein